jgi:heme exporter protein D
MSAFLNMGGYADFVWPAFALTAVVLIGLLTTSVRSLRANEARLAELEAAVGRQRREGGR